MALPRNLRVNFLMDFLLLCLPLILASNDKPPVPIDLPQEPGQVDLPYPGFDNDRDMYDGDSVWGDSSYGGDYEDGLYGFEGLENMMTFQLKDSEFFYEDVTEIGTMIRGMFFSQSGDGKIGFVVLDPNNKKVYEHEGKRDGYFKVKAELVGTYTFMFTGNQKQVSFIVGSGKKTNLKKEHLSKLEEQITEIDKKLRDIQQEGSYLWTKQKRDQKVIENINYRVFFFALIEFLVLTSVAIFQVLYLKNLLSYRRLY